MVYVLRSTICRYYLTGSDAIRLKLRVKPRVMDFEQPPDGQQAAAEGYAEVSDLADTVEAHSAADTLQRMSLQATGAGDVDVDAAAAAALTVTPMGGASTAS